MALRYFAWAENNYPVKNSFIKWINIELECVFPHKKYSNIMYGSPHLESNEKLLTKNSEDPSYL